MAFTPSWTDLQTTAKEDLKENFIRHYVLAKKHVKEAIKAADERIDLMERQGKNTSSFVTLREEMIKLCDQILLRLTQSQ